MTDNTNKEQRRLDQYQFLWNGSCPSWHLLQRHEVSSSGESLYWPFNIDHPTQIVNEGCLPGWVIEKMQEHHVPVISCEHTLADPLQDYCWRAGYSYQVIIQTFDYLIPHWENVVTFITSGNIPDFYEYLNDMDGRRILDELFELTQEVPTRLYQRVMMNDERLHPWLRAYSSCIWGKSVAQKHDYTREKHWYYYSVPIHAPEQWGESA